MILKNKAERLQINRSSGTLEALAGGKKILSLRGRRTIQGCENPGIS
jgi:hypothetical protein